MSKTNVYATTSGAEELLDIYTECSRKLFQSGEAYAVVTAFDSLEPAALKSMGEHVLLSMTLLFPYALDVKCDSAH